MIRILIDADACPVVKTAERIAKERRIPVILFGVTNHVLSSDYTDIRVIGAGADAVDFALMNESRSGDIIITQDYGVAAMGWERALIPFIRMENGIPMRTLIRC